MDAKTRKLRQLCKAHELGTSELCELTGRGESIVHHWLSGKHKQIPDHMLELLELKLARETQTAKEA